MRVKSPFSHSALFGLVIRRSSHRRCKDAGVRGRRLVTFPERIVRSGAAILGGAVHETAQVVLPRFVRQSRVYEATAKNVLRITIELVGGVEHAAEPDEPTRGQARRPQGCGQRRRARLDRRVRVLAALAARRCERPRAWLARLSRRARRRAEGQRRARDRTPRSRASTSCSACSSAAPARAPR